MTDRSAQSQRSRLAACLAAAGLLFAPPTALAQTQLPPPAYGNADTRQDRIEELESQLRDATAENERMQNELNQAQREVRRLQGMVSELTGVNQALSTPTQPSTQAPAQTTSPPAPSPRSNNSATPQPQQQGQLGTLSADQLPGDAGQAYGQARQLLLRENYAEAEVAWQEFLRRFPDAETAPDARFWLGYTLAARNNHRDAAASFVEYLQNSPRGPRAAEAQVRLGMELMKMSDDGQNDAAERRQACAAFTRLPANAPANVRTLAARESAAARCAA